ncbi:MAG: DNA-directed RNA polymerase subunit N [Candidatus Micrarchaeota archaeon]|nr:DNA-directed RNA polymerase subunit N [Candidatus Micrarchaeota archaeon]
MQRAVGDGYLVELRRQRRRAEAVGEDAGKVLDDMKVKRYCCRRMLISHVDLIDDVIGYGRK